MGYIKHHSIIVTGWDEKKMLKAQNKAVKLFTKHLGEPQLISSLVTSNTNGQVTFFIAPDGSKEGWETSNNGDTARCEFIDYLNTKQPYLDYVELKFGGDETDICSITRRNK